MAHLKREAPSDVYGGHLKSIVCATAADLIAEDRRRSGLNSNTPGRARVVILNETPQRDVWKHNDNTWSIFCNLLLSKQ
jgi:hypothetical protein